MKGKKVSKKRSKRISKLIVANWKMNPDTAEEAKNLFRTIAKVARTLSGVQTVICPPFPYMALSKTDGKVKLGAQNTSVEERGAHTSSVSSSMLRSLGTEYVIVGHSECRAAGESNEMVAKKIRSVIQSGMMPIVCIGETHRDTDGNYLAAIREQLRQSLVYTERAMLTSVIIAYEPVWAIGGKEAIQSHDIHQAVIFIRKVLTELYPPEVVRSIRILYGGSSNAGNADDILRHGEVTGLLVGGASLDPKNFGEMLRIAAGI